MLRMLVMVTAATSISVAHVAHVAHAAPPDLHKCAEAAIAELPEAERAAWMALLDDRIAPDLLDQEEQRAMIDARNRVTLLRDVVALAVRARDLPRARRLVKQMETDAATLPAGPPMDVAIRETSLARANALAGQLDPARAHLAVAVAALAKVEPDRADFAHHEVLIAAVTLGDDALGDTEMAAFLAALGPGDHGRIFENTGRDLAAVGGARQALRLAELAGPARDAVLAAILEGSIAGKESARKDIPLALEILGKISGARERLAALQQLATLAPRLAQRSKAFVAAIQAALPLEAQPGIDDAMRRDLVETAAIAGLTTPARTVASKIENPWMRAHAEAMIAAALAVSDPRAGIALARTALGHARPKGARPDARDDQAETQRALRAACSALTRAAALDEARRLCQPAALDIVVGLRGRPAELAGWWKRAAPLDRANVLLYAASGDLPLDDLSFMQSVCK